MTTTPARQVNCGDCAIRLTCALGRLGTEERSLIAPRIRERIFHRGDVLLEENKVAAFVRVVKVGTVVGYRRGLDSRSRPIGILSRGGALGMFATFGMPSQARCVALTKGRACEIPAAELVRAGACSPKLLEQIGRSVVEVFGALSAWSEAMRLPGVVNQLAYVMVLLAEASKAFVVELPSHAALAELLGTRRETIARALRLLEQEGGIRRHEHKRCEVTRNRLLARLVHGAR